MSAWQPYNRNIYQFKSLSLFPFKKGSSILYKFIRPYKLTENIYLWKPRLEVQTWTGWIWFDYNSWRSFWRGGRPSSCVAPKGNDLIETNFCQTHSSRNSYSSPPVMTPTAPPFPFPPHIKLSFTSPPPSCLTSTPPPATCSCLARIFPLSPTEGEVRRIEAKALEARSSQNTWWSWGWWGPRWYWWWW